MGEIIEITELEQCERIIENGLKTFVDVGNALLKVRDNRLYREQQYKTFEDYCRERWNMARSRAYQLIDAATVVDNVYNCGQILPATESQARPLSGLSPDKQREAWQLVIDKAPETGITAAIVLQAAKHIQAERREEKRAERVEIITRETVPAENLGPFNVIYADPPWRYEYSISTSRDIENQYPTMEIDEICSMRVPAARDCVLLLWATSPKLAEVNNGIYD